ncbi:YtxH domain-containing protein [Clostridium tagluense]|uniref:YtxH domain-containing protein n=1 Tax=Clostridium tagluense TaxID=360422 RepID=UPI001C6E5013|nr:YtxH domain-containing protein [Clostridium tagluense]MBW9156642.1 YtxH domain-containing protein [Clostridium tagluense]MCB2296951.1 YtxH domain-containing protein [Clostridium tagluense]MCB2311753.1 YtxH domain-containing protein [Clostridium tagluense]MCB2316525.1 YtxH domain-containing protein [Clostridium tagluense]MCB2321333.1 YtxH domain-containing protein [Clostridium tagluense]
MILTKWYEKKKKEKQRKLRIQTAKKILIGTAAGSVSGLLGGLLFSPKSGKENREDIANSSKEITNNIKEKTIELKGTINDNVTDAKVKIKRKSTELKDAINNKVCDAKDNVTDAKVKVSQYLNEKKTANAVFETVDNLASTDSEDLNSILGQTDLVEKDTKK